MQQSKSEQSVGKTHWKSWRGITFIKKNHALNTQFLSAI